LINQVRALCSGRRQDPIDPQGRRALPEGMTVKGVIDERRRY
jgi:hypothetical protein